MLDVWQTIFHRTLFTVRRTPFHRTLFVVRRTLFHRTLFSVRQTKFHRTIAKTFSIKHLFVWQTSSCRTCPCLLNTFPSNISCCSAKLLCAEHVLVPRTHALSNLHSCLANLLTTPNFLSFDELIPSNNLNCCALLLHPLHNTTWSPRSCLLSRAMSSQISSY